MTSKFPDRPRIVRPLIGEGGPVTDESLDRSGRELRRLRTTMLIASLVVAAGMGAIAIWGNRDMLDAIGAFVLAPFVGIFVIAQAAVMIKGR